MLRDMSLASIPMIMLAVLLLMLLGGCTPVASLACPRVTEFPVELQRAAAAELRTGTVPALDQMMEAMNRDRAANRAICPR